MGANLGSKMEQHEFGNISGEFIRVPTPKLKQFIESGQTKESSFSVELSRPLVNEF